MVNRVTYMVDGDGYLFARKGSMVAFPVLQFEDIGKGGDFRGSIMYSLETDDVIRVLPYSSAVPVAAAKVPAEIRELYRQTLKTRDVRKGLPVSRVSLAS